MRYNDVGKTGLRVSEVSFGAGTAAGLMIHGTVEDQVASIRSALDSGINHFDTAALYGFGASEIYLGQALRMAGSKDELITSKVAIGPEFLMTAEIGRCVRRSVEQSLSRLRREAVDFLLVHNGIHRTHKAYDPMRESERVAHHMNNYLPRLTFDDILGEAGVIDEIELLIKEGKVRYFGLSGQDNEPDMLRALIASGSISMFNQTYNLLNPSGGFPQARKGRYIGGAFARDQRELFIEFDDVIEYARISGVGVSVISPLAAGVLTDSAKRGEAPAPVSRRSHRFPRDGQFDQQVRLAWQFGMIAERAGMSLSELAVRFVLSSPGVTTMVAGFSNAEQVKEISGHAEKPPLGEDVLDALNEVWFGPGIASDGTKVAV